MCRPSVLLTMFSEVQSTEDESTDVCCKMLVTHSLAPTLLTSRASLVVQTLSFPHAGFDCTRTGPTTAKTPLTERLRPPTVTCEGNCLGTTDRKPLHLPGLHTSDC